MNAGFASIPGSYEADRESSLARFSHGLSTAAADPGMSTALRSVGFLDVLSSTPAESSRRAPCIHARLRRLATKSREKSGLTAKRTKYTKVISRISCVSWSGF